MLRIYVMMELVIDRNVPTRLYMYRYYIHV